MKNIQSKIFGFASGVPIAYLAFMLFTNSGNRVFFNLGTICNNFWGIILFLVVHLSIVFLNLFLIIIFIKYIVGKKQWTTNRKVKWIVLVVWLNIVAVPLFWFLIVNREK